MAATFSWSSGSDALEYQLLKQTPNTLDVNVTACRYDITAASEFLVAPRAPPGPRCRAAGLLPLCVRPVMEARPVSRDHLASGSKSMAAIDLHWSRLDIRP